MTSGSKTAVAIPHVLIADEAEEMIGDASAGGGDGDLVGRWKLLKSCRPS
jgi:hypothetical protein